MHWASGDPFPGVGRFGAMAPGWRDNPSRHERREGSIVTGYALPRARQPDPTTQSDFWAGRQAEPATQADTAAVRGRGAHGRLQSRPIAEDDPVTGRITPSGKQHPAGGIQGTDGWIGWSSSSQSHWATPIRS